MLQSLTNISKEIYPWLLSLPEIQQKKRFKNLQQLNFKISIPFVIIKAGIDIHDMITYLYKIYYQKNHTHSCKYVYKEALNQEEQSADS